MTQEELTEVLEEMRITDEVGDFFIFEKEGDEHV